nr:hypothetical protein [uncultured Flavobacterium sp.]
MFEKIFSGLALLMSKNIQDSLLYNIIKDFVYPLLLTVLSGVVAWFLFIKQIVNDKQKTENSKEEDLRNKLTYFAMIIHNAIENAEGQNIKLFELINDIENAGINSVTLQKHPTYDLTLIAEKIDKENYLLSYLSFYSKNEKKEMLSDFKKIMDSCGIINDIFLNINANLNAKNMFEIELRKEFHESVLECADYFGKSLVKLKEINDPLFYQLFEINKNLEHLEHYSEEQIMPAQYQIFLKPTLELLDNCHRTQKEFDEDTGNLWNTTVKTMSIYHNLQSETLRLKAILINHNEYVNELIIQLKKSSEKLVRDFIN